MHQDQTTAPLPNSSVPPFVEAAKRVLRYVRQTITYAIMYRAKGSGRDDGLVGYVDASYGNATKVRSTSGYVFLS